MTDDDLDDLLAARDRKALPRQAKAAETARLRLRTMVQDTRLPETEVARLVGVDRMTIRRWRGKR